MIGRKKEIKMLRNAAESKCSEFVAVYGRRRVGKTFLVRETFNSNFTFQHSGVANSGTKIQLERFRRSLIESGHARCPALKTWFQAFDELKTVVVSSNMGKKVLFIDEMPWMDKPNANFIPALENFWNAWASARKDVLLIVCGSATSWMLNKVIHGRGGLHNRVTVRIPLRPFCLSECEELAASMGLEATRYQLVQYYMALGGVPYYWNYLQCGLSVAQNMDAMFFAGEDRLEGEFAELFASLFAKDAPYVRIVEALCSRRMGLMREEIARTTGIPNSGTLTKYLCELEQCGFVRRYRMGGRRVRDAIYQLVDNFSLFHFRFVRANRNGDPVFWSSSADKSALLSWQGLSFELVCLEHVEQIKRALQIGGVHSLNYAWRCERPQDDAERGAQIDLVIDRDDGIVNLCEMKFSSKEYALTSEDDSSMRNKRAAFRRETKSRKAVHFTYVTTFGLLRNRYAGEVQSEVTLDDLFKS